MLGTMRKSLLTSVVGLLLCFAGSAVAQSKSWTAVQKSINPSASVVFGVNLKPIRATTTYTAGLQMLLSEEESAKQAFEMIKSTCNIDVPTAVSDATFVMKDDEKPLVVLGLDGLDETKVVGCLEKIGGQMAGKSDLKLTRKKVGKLTEYSMPGEKKKLYVAWLAADVLAFTDDPNDKGKLTKMLAGKAPRGVVGAGLSKLSTASPIWAAVAKKEKEDVGTILGGYGQLDINAGVITVTGHVVWSKPAEATAALAEAQNGLAEAKTKAAKSPGIVKVLNTVTLAVTGKELDFKASVDDKEIMKLLPEMDHLF
jgi:hypothetical protein